MEKNSPASKTVTQIAIRLKQHDGRYVFKTTHEDGTRFQTANVPLTFETAKRQLSLYRKAAEATVVTRKVVIIEDAWEEI